MEDLDCYIFEDISIPLEIRTMSFLCEECKEKYYPDTEMYFHQGTTEGYGPFTYECSKCDRVIHKDESKIEDDECQKLDQ